MKDQTRNQSKIPGSRWMGKWVMALCAAIGLAMEGSSHAQQVISGDYTQNFNSMGSTGSTNSANTLPDNWSVRTGATSTALGAATTAVKSTWGDSAGNFRNVAASTGLTSGASTTVQNNATDRALGIRQTGSFANPGASFNFFFSTVGYDVSQISIDLMLVSVQGRSTEWTIQYGLGVTPSSWLTLDTYTDPAAFGSTAFTFNSSDFGTDLNNQAAVWFRVVALSASTGSNNNDTYAIDNFSLSATASGGGGSTFSWGTGGVGGSGTWDTTTANWYNGTTNVAWSSTETGVFAGTAGNVAVAAGGITVQNGLQFNTSGYAVSGNSLNLTGTSAAVNSISVASGSATISSALVGTAGVTKAGAGKLILSGNNSGLSGGINLGGGVLAVSSAASLGSNILTLNAGTFSSADNTALTIANTVQIAGDVGLGEASSGNLNFSGSVGLGGATRVLTVGSGVTATLSGSYGNGGISVAGSGLLEFAASGTLTTLGVTSGTAKIDSGVTLTLNTTPLSVTGGSLLIDGTLLSTITSSGWNAPTAPVVVGSSGTVIQQGAGSPTNFLFDSDVTWQTGSKFIFRDYTNSPAVSNRTYNMNVIFDTSGSPVSVGGIAGTGTWTMNGDLTIGAGVVFNYNAGNTLTTTFNGNVNVSGTMGGTNGARSFAIASGKSLTLGTGGAVILESGQSITIGNGATLAGSGSISGGTVTVNGNLNPGSSPGVLTVDTLVLGNTAQTVMEIQGTVPGTTLDVVMGTSLTFGGDLELSLSGLSYLGTTVTLFDFSSYTIGLDSVSLTGAFTLALNNQGAGAWSNSYVVNEVGTYSFSFNENNGEFLASFVAVPEPSTYVLVGLGFGMLLLRLRRRQS